MTRERDYFREVLRRTKDAIKELDLTIERPVNQVEVEVHYSFDYAQQVRELTILSHIHANINNAGALPQ